MRSAGAGARTMGINVASGCSLGVCGIASSLTRCIGKHSIVGEFNRLNIYLIMRFGMPKIPKGHIIEFGSYRGGNAMFMAKVAGELFPGTMVYALDTYDGMPATDAKIDLHLRGDFRDAEYDEFLRRIDRYNVTNCIPVRGLFEHTAAKTLISAGAIALAHIDCDTADSVAYSYEIVKPYMVENGYIVFDDANQPTCLGATEAVEEYVIRNDGMHAEQIWPNFVFRSRVGSAVTQLTDNVIKEFKPYPLVDLDLLEKSAIAQQLADRVTALESSTSWKVTRPLRALGSVWKLIQQAR